MDAFDTANGPTNQPVNSLSPGGSQPPGDAFDSAAMPAEPKDAFDTAATQDWGTLAHQAIAQREAAEGPLHDTQKLAIIQAYRQQYGGMAAPAANESLQQMAMKTAADNTFGQNASAAFGNALSHGATGAVGLVSPSTGQALRQDQLGAYGMAQPDSGGDLVGGTIGGAINSVPAMFGGPGGILLSGLEAAGNKRIDIADQRAGGANISGGREAATAALTGGIDIGTNYLAQKLLGHVRGRIAKTFGGDIAGAIAAGDAGGAAEALVKMMVSEFGKEVVGNQAIAQIQNTAQNAVNKLTQSGVKLTDNAGRTAAQALIQSVLLSPLSPLMHGMNAGGGEPNNPTPERPADYSPLDIQQNIGPQPATGTVGKRMYAGDADIDQMFKLGEGANAGDEPAPAAANAHPPVLNGPADVGDYYARTYNDPQNAVTIQAMASMNPGRFVRARVPIDQIEPGVLGEADKSQEKIDQLAAMTPEQRQALNPGILVQQRDGKFMPADGTHRFMGAAQAGDKVYNAYVPESAIGKNGVVAHSANSPAESSPVEAPATTGSSPDTGIGETKAAPESQPLTRPETPPAQTVQSESPAIATAKQHYPDLQTVEPQTREQKEAASVASQLGVNPVFFTGAHEGRGFVLKDHPDTVFISAPSNRGVDAIRQAVGHELTRSLARVSPESFKPILDAIPAADLSAAQQEYRAKLGSEAATDPHESAAALILGKAATNERVWRAMSGKDPTAFEAFADRVSEMFGKLTEKGRTLNKIVDAWNKVRPELQENANESVEKNGTDAATANEPAVNDTLAGGHGRDVVRGPEEAAERPSAKGPEAAGPAAAEATGKAEVAAAPPADETPVMRQYRQFKKTHPDYLILFKMGDFYEAFHDDARKLAKTTGVTLTTRSKPGGEQVAMAGVPFHAVEGYMRKLIAAGHKVAIAEPSEAAPKSAPQITHTLVPDDAAGFRAEAEPPKNAKEAKARRGAKNAPPPEPTTEQSGLPKLSKLAIEKTAAPPPSEHGRLQAAEGRLRESYRATGKQLEQMEADARGSDEAKAFVQSEIKGLRGNARKRGTEDATRLWLMKQPEYAALLDEYLKKQAAIGEAQDAQVKAGNDYKQAVADQHEADVERFKDKLRAYPWWELEKFVDADQQRRMSGYGNRTANAPPEMVAAAEVLREKEQQMQGEATPPEGSEKLASKAFKPGPPLSIRLPAGPKSDLKPWAESYLEGQAEKPATHTATVATEATAMEARKYIVGKWESNAARKAIDKAQGEGASNFKQFIRTVPEFALNPKFTIGQDASLHTTLDWNDGNGGVFRFTPEHVGILPAGDLKPGETIGVDPEAVKGMKKGDTLIVKPSGNPGPAGPPDVELLPTAGAVAKGLVNAGPSFFQQDVIPTVRNGVNAVKGAIKSADRFWNGSALDPTADTTKEHLREAWAQNDLDRVRTEAFFKPAREMASHYSESAMVQGVEAIENGQPFPDAKMQPFADEIRRVNADLAGEAAKVGLDTRKWTPDYVRRIFEFPDPNGLFPEEGGAVPGWTSSIAGAEHFLKSRVFDDFGDSLKFVKSVGGRLKYDNFIDMQLAGWEQIRKGISMRREFNEAIGRGDVAVFAPHDKLPDGWKYLDDKLATLHAAPTWTTLPNGRRAETENIRARYAAPENLANIFNDNLAPGLYGKLPLWKRWAGINHFQTSINLGLSGAHMMNMATGGAGISFAEAADNVLKGEFNSALVNTLRGVTAPIYHAWNGGRIRQAARVAGSIPGLEPLVDGIVAGGGRFGFDSVLDKTSWQNAKSDFASGNIIGGTGHAANAAWKLLSYPLFKMYIPNIKASLLANAAETELQRTVGDRDALRENMGRWSNAVDNVLGQVVQDNKFQHRVIQDAMQGIFMAPNWNEGLARLVGGSARDYVRAAVDMKNGKSPTVTPAMLIPFGAVLAHMATAAAINRVLSGQWPQTFKDYFQPRNGQKDNEGNDMRSNLLTPFKDIPAWANAPGRTLWNKMTPLIHMAHDIAVNSDYHGVEIRHPGDPLGKQAGDVVKYLGKAALPFSVQSYQRMNEVGANAGRKALGFAGLNPVPSYVANTKAEQLAQTLNVTEHPPGTRTQEQFDRAELRGRLGQAIRSDQPGAGQAARDALKSGKITEEDYVKMIATKKQSYLERSVGRLGVDDAMRVYNVASDDEKRTLIMDLMKKVDSSHDWESRPDEMKRYLTVLRDDRTRLKKK